MRACAWMELQVSRNECRELVTILKTDICSHGGVTEEIVCALPPFHFEQFRLGLQSAVDVGKGVSLLPEHMRINMSTLVPKCPVPASLSHYRPVAGLTAARNMVWVWNGTFP